MTVRYRASSVPCFPARRQGIVIAVAFATGNWLPAILISLLFNLAQLGAKPVRETTPQDTVLVPPNDGAAADSRAISDSPIL